MKNYKIFYQVILFIVSILFIILGFIEKINDIWFSVGVAVGVCSGLRIIRHIRMTKDPKYKTKIMIEQTDERNIKIAEKASFLAFRFVLFIMCIVELVLFAFNMITIGTYIGFIICFMLVVYWLTYIVLNKKM